MAEVITIGLDIAKNVFQAHGADAGGHQVFSRRIARGKVLEFFAGQPKCLVALEACGGAHHWARELIGMGHDVRLIPPAYVKPFVKRQKNDSTETRTIKCRDQTPRASSVKYESRCLLYAFVVASLFAENRFPLFRAMR